MFRNYLKIAFRNLSRQKVYSFINISGFAIGITSCLLICMYVFNELHYDRQHTKADRIYRITSSVNLTNQKDHVAMSSFMLAPDMKQDFPDVEDAIRIMPIGKQTIWANHQVYQFSDIYFSDSTFFNVFDYEFLQGDAHSCLKDPRSIVISEELAKTVFGNAEAAYGEALQFSRLNYKITGVFKNQKNNSHLNLAGVISISSLQPQYTQQLSNDWFYLAQSNYILLKPGVSKEKLVSDLNLLKKKHVDPWLKENKLQGDITFYPQALQEIHLSQGLSYDYAQVTSPAYLYIFSSVAFFILIIACINYMNLATARSAKRAREVGIRKTAGANRKTLIVQFLGESLFMTLLSVIIAICLTELFLPLFNNLTGKELSFHLFTDLRFLSIFSCVILFSGILAGSYPAFYLSRFQAVDVLKSNSLPKGGGAALRKILVVIQFGISTILIISTVVVYSQMQFMKNKSLGFNKDNLLAIKVPVADSSFAKNLEQIKHELSKEPSIVNITGSNDVPGVHVGRILQFVENNGRMEERLMNMMMVDYDFLNSMEIPIVKGRPFDKRIITDDTSAFIVNETAVKQFGWKNPLVVKMENGFNYKGHIIGVVKDFNYASLHHPIEPLVIIPIKKVPGNLLIRIQPGKSQHALKYVEEKWKMFSKKYPFEYYFLDDQYKALYQAEEKMLLIFAIFSSLTIAIACLGLFALSTFTAEQRTKEIGVRKILGASTSDIVVLLSKDFITLVLIGLAIGAPLAYLAMHKWLENFAFKEGQGILPFIITGFFALLIAFGTVSWQAFKTAYSNPVDSIKYE